MATLPPANHEGLQFFGKISASVTHEIKNVFAVINEAAGLIDDFTIMAGKGMPIDPERLKKAAKSIQGQVQRGDGIIKNMNAFSHSTDEAAHEVDLVEILTLIVALSTRMADMKQVTLTLGACRPTVLCTEPFELMRLIHMAIMTALKSMVPGETLTIVVNPVPEGASFSLSVVGRILSAPTEPALTNLAQQLCFMVATDMKHGTLDLTSKHTA